MYVIPGKQQDCNIAGHNSGWKIKFAGSSFETVAELWSLVNALVYNIWADVNNIYLFQFHAVSRM